MIDYSIFETSLHRLQEQHGFYLDLDQQYPQAIREGMTESVVRRFKASYDTLWKALRRYLIVVLGIPDVPNSPKPVFAIAKEHGLLDSSVDQWFNYAQARIDTSHDYDGEKAKACLVLIPRFIDDATTLFTSMSGEKWGRSIC